MYVNCIFNVCNPLFKTSCRHWGQLIGILINQIKPHSLNLKTTLECFFLTVDIMLRPTYISTLLTT